MPKPKSIYPLAAVMIALVIVQCNKSNDPAIPSIVGTWKLTSSAVVNCSNSSQNSAEAPCSSNCITLTFTADSYKSSDGNGTPAPYNTSGSILNLGYAGTTATDPYTYSVTTTTLSLTSESIGPAACQTLRKYTRQ